MVDVDDSCQFSAEAAWRVFRDAGRKPTAGSRNAQTPIISICRGFMYVLK